MGLINVGHRLIDSRQIVYLEPFLPEKAPGIHQEEPSMRALLVTVNGERLFTRLQRTTEIAIANNFRMLAPHWHIALNSEAAAKLHVKPIRPVKDPVTNRVLLSSLFWRKNGFRLSKRLPAAPELVRDALRGKVRIHARGAAEPV